MKWKTAHKEVPWPIANCENKLQRDDEGKLEVKFSADFPISCCCPQKKLEIHATDSQKNWIIIVIIIWQWKTKCPQSLWKKLWNFFVH